MLLPLAVAALVTGLSARPPALTGGDARAYAAWLHQRTLVADRAFGAPPCPAAEVRSVLGRPLQPGEVAPWSGTRQGWSGPAFFERVRLTGCGRTAVQNFQVTRLRRGGWEAMGTLPGELLSSPRQQTELTPALATVILNGAPALPCRSSEALRSMTHGEGRVLSQPSAAGGAWTERWPVRACGVDRTVDVTFAPRERPRIAPAWSR